MSAKEIKKIDKGTLLESQLREYCQRGLVSYLKILRKTLPKKRKNASKDSGDKIGYELHVQLTYKEEEDTLITMNSKRARTWVNLDRMTEHIFSEYSFTGTLFLENEKKKDEQGEIPE